MVSKKIVVIGGGEIGRPGYKVETTKLDKEIIRLSGKKHPKLLFLPTASSDSESYVDVVHKHFGKRLSCKIDELMLLKEKYTKLELSDKILGADIIYVGGGNTLKMMRRWRFLGVDKLLRRAYEKGVILSGLSAGGICWFNSGHSDSMSFYSPKKWDYIKVGGLGLLRGIHCPHFSSGAKGKKRRKAFIGFMKKYNNIGIGIDEKCALEIVDDKYRVISVSRRANAYRVFKKKGKVIVDRIPKRKTYSPMEEIYKK